MTPRLVRDWNGQPRNVTRRIKWTIRRAARHGLVPTATTNGNHAPGSWHKPVPGRNRRGRAVDLGFTAKDLNRLSLAERRRRLEAFQRAEYARARRIRFRTYLELIGPLNGVTVLRGHGPVALAEGSALEDLHDTHVHVAR